MKSIIIFLSLFFYSYTYSAQKEKVDILQVCQSVHKSAYLKLGDYLRSENLEDFLFWQPNTELNLSKDEVHIMDDEVGEIGSFALRVLAREAAQREMFKSEKKFKAQFPKLSQFSFQAATIAQINPPFEFTLIDKKNCKQGKSKKSDFQRILNSLTNNDFSLASKQIWRKAFEMRYGKTYCAQLQDAYRHIYWTALLSRVLGSQMAQCICALHETPTKYNGDLNIDFMKTKSDFELRATYMDLVNNAIGVMIGRNFNGTYQELGEEVARYIREGKAIIQKDRKLVPSSVYYFDN